MCGHRRSFRISLLPPSSFCLINSNAGQEVCESKLFKWIQIQFSLAGDHLVEVVLLNKLYMCRKSKREEMERDVMQRGKVKGCLPWEDVDNTNTVRFTHSVPDLWQTDSNIQTTQTYSEVWYVAKYKCWLDRDWPLWPYTLQHCLTCWNAQNLNAQNFIFSFLTLSAGVCGVHSM